MPRKLPCTNCLPPVSNIPPEGILEREPSVRNDIYSSFDHLGIAIYLNQVQNQTESFRACLVIVVKQA